MNSTRRNKLPQNPACESLEGRQLLTAGPDLGMAPGFPPTEMNGAADVSMTEQPQAPSGFWGRQGNIVGQNGPERSGLSFSAIPGMPGQGNFGGQASLSTQGNFGPQANFGGQANVGPQGNFGGQAGLGIQGKVGLLGNFGGQAGLGIQGDFGPQGNFGGQNGPQGFDPGMTGRPNLSGQDGFGVQGNFGIPNDFASQGTFGVPGGGQGSPMGIPGMIGLDAIGGQDGPLSHGGGMPGGFGGGPGGFSPDGPMSFGPGDFTGSDSTDTTSQLHTDLEKLRTDMQAIHDKSEVTPAMQAKVRDSMKAVLDAATETADPDALEALQTESKDAWSSPGGPTEEQLANIQAAQDAVFKSQGVSDELIAQLSESLKAIQVATGITDADRELIAADQEAIKADWAARSDSIPTDPAMFMHTMKADSMAPPAISNSADLAAVSSEAVTIDPAAPTEDITVTGDPTAVPEAPPAVVDPTLAYSSVPTGSMAKGPSRSLPIGAMAKNRSGAASFGSMGQARANSASSSTSARPQTLQRSTSMPQTLGQQIMTFGRSLRRPRG